MTRILAIFEKGIVITLLLLMMLAILLATVELGVILYQQLVAPPFLLLNMKEIMEVFSFFLMVLIGLELLETIKTYLQQDKVHVEVVLLVAMVAIARKIITLEHKTLKPDLLFGMAAVIIALAIGYYLIKQVLDAPQKTEKAQE